MLHWQTPVDDEPVTLLSASAKCKARMLRFRRPASQDEEHFAFQALYAADVEARLSARNINSFAQKAWK